MTDPLAVGYDRLCACADAILMARECPELPAAVKVLTQQFTFEEFRQARLFLERMEYIE